MADVSSAPEEAGAPEADRGEPLPGYLRWAWIAALLGMPFYLFPSGRPQPTDFALVLLASVPALAAGSVLQGWYRTAAQRAAVFVGLVTIVNVAWMVITGSTDFLTSTLFYLFNLTVLAGVLVQVTRYRERLLRTIAWTTGASLFIQLGLAFVFPGLTVGRRLSLFFNNPNQLAYYALGAATVILLASYGVKLPRWLLLASLAAAGFLTYRTYSRAAALGIAALVGIAVMRRPWIAVAIALPALVYAAADDASLEADAYWEMRMSEAMTSDADDYLEDRGLERIVDNPEYLLFGAGEGEHIRFHPLGLELHSSLATVAFSYGVLGLATFFAMLAIVLQAGPSRLALLLGPSLFYGLFHNGLRFRIFWLVLAVAVASAIAARERQAAGGGELPP